MYIKDAALWNEVYRLKHQYKLGFEWAVHRRVATTSMTSAMRLCGTRLT